MNSQILITLLTSSKIDYLIDLYNSIINQIDTNITYDIVIIVNTLLPDYYKQVDEYFKKYNNCKIIQTISNGLPGKGHNSVIDYFRQHAKYDYLIPIDGDDFLYPYFLHRMEYYLEKKPDVLNLMFSDILSNTYSATNAFHINIFNKAVLNYNVEDITVHQYYTILSLFNNNINNTLVPGRIIMLSRKAVSYPIYYNEMFTMYEDIIIFLQVFELFKQNKLKLFNILDSNLYLYNCINTSSVSKNQNSIQFERLQLQCKYTLLNKFNSIREWNLKDIPVLKHPNSEIRLDIKLTFCESLSSIIKKKPIQIDLSHLKLFQDYANKHSIHNMIEIYQPFFNDSANIIKLFNSDILFTFRENDYISNVLKVYKCWEPTITNIIFYILNKYKSPIFFDIGCNIGYYSVINSLNCNKIYSFDMNDVCIKKFQQSLFFNNIKNINIIYSCITNDENNSYTVPKINYNYRNEYINIGGLQSIKSDESTEIPSIVLDNFIQKENISIIELIKIDIEGDEYNALLGASHHLKNHLILNIIIEVSPYIPKQKSREILMLLFKYNYNLYEIGLNDYGPFKYDTSSINNIYSNKITDIDDFLKKIGDQTNILATVETNN